MVGNLKSVRSMRELGSREGEEQWKENFNVMASKNNDKLHRNYHEYFDRPVEYDVSGYT